MHHASRQIKWKRSVESWGDTPQEALRQQLLSNQYIRRYWNMIVRQAVAIIKADEGSSYITFLRMSLALETDDHVKTLLTKYINDIYSVMSTHNNT